VFLEICKTNTTYFFSNSVFNYILLAFYESTVTLSIGISFTRPLAFITLIFSLSYNNVISATSIVALIDLLNTRKEVKIERPRLSLKLRGTNGCK
jgi:hypothetical protein